MSDFSTSPDTPGEEPQSSAQHRATDTAESEPAFGLVDLVEAFTAMRHEYRLQTRESRELAEELLRATERIEQVSQRGPLAIPPTAPEIQPSDGLREWVDSLIEVDLVFTRAFDVLQRTSAAQQRSHTACPGAESADSAPSHPLQPRGDAAELVQEIRRQLAGVGPLGRLLSLGRFRRIGEALERHQREAEANRREDATTEGLRMVLQRVRQLLAARGIERFETVGTPFDAETMNAVEAVESEQHPAGEVIRQLSPVYRWQGQVVRFAEVVVARPKRTS